MALRAGRCAISVYLGVPLLIVIAILQSSVLPRFPILGYVPNLMLLTVIGWGFHRGFNDGMVWAVIGGLVLDLASGWLLGLSPVPLLAATLVAGFGRGRVHHASAWLPPVFVFAALVVYQFLYLVLLALTGQPVDWQVGIFRISIPLIVLHMVLMPVVYYATAWLARLVETGPRLRLG